MLLKTITFWQQDTTELLQVIYIARKMDACVKQLIFIPEKGMSYAELFMLSKTSFVKPHCMAFLWMEQLFIVHISLALYVQN